MNLAHAHRDPDGTVPPIDLETPSVVETATFSLG